jgi:RNA-directed DNA polymerase
MWRGSRVLPDLSGNTVKQSYLARASHRETYFSVGTPVGAQGLALFMRALLQNAIRNECDKHIERYFEYLDDLHEYAERRSRREGSRFDKSIKVRRWWRIAPQFNPFNVRTKKKLGVYAKTLSQAIRNRKYSPRPALVRYVPKGDGRRRVLNIFQLPDAALSKLVYKSLLAKNVLRFSAYAYAYREDRTAHDAVNEIFNDFSKLDRVYVAEYDFSGFFDEIEHSYLWHILDDEKFIVSPDERHVIDSFLTSQAADMASYPVGTTTRTKGIPQGTSISLFLANVACWELDRGFERLGVRFARYADDTLIWSEDYDKVVRAYYWIDKCAARMGVPLSAKKSHGISLLSKIGKTSEMAHKHYINYLGYRISLDHISIADSKLAEIKARISFLAYQNLVQPLKRGIFNDLRLLSGLDLDYATAVRQIRFYLYGGLTAEKLDTYLSGKVTNLNFRGVMSYYPIVNDVEQLAKLDAWIAYVLRQSLRLRQKLWQTRGVSLPGPTKDWLDRLEELRDVMDPITGTTADLTFPSARLMQRAMALAIRRKGIQAVANPSSRYY